MKKHSLAKLSAITCLVLSIAATSANAAEVMRVDGKQLLDSNGQPVLVRGIECLFGPTGAANVETYVNALAGAGFNAVRAQLWTTDLAKIEEFIARCQGKGMVVFLTDDTGPLQDNFFQRADVQAMVERNKYNLVIDASTEEGGDPQQDPGVVAAWLDQQKSLITQFRAWGYTQPLTIGTPKAGRYLRALLDHGQELIDHDPLHSLVLNAQMYWGDYDSPDGWSYQRMNGFSDGDQGVREATAAVAAKSFLIQFGLDAYDSGGGWAAVPYELLMTEAQDKGIGTMWWQWRDSQAYDPANPEHDNPNSLVMYQLDGNSLKPLGDIVINLHPDGIRNTSVLVSQPYP